MSPTSRTRSTPGDDVIATWGAGHVHMLSTADTGRAGDPYRKESPERGRGSHRQAKRRGIRDVPHRQRRGRPDGADRQVRDPQGHRPAAHRADARGQRARRRARRLPRTGAHDLLSALADRGRGRARRLLRAADARARDPAPVRGGEEARRRLLSRLCRAGRRGRGEAALQHLHPRRPHRARSSASTARCICPAMPSRSRAARSSTWRSDTSSRATSASGVARLRRRHGHVHLQRPPLAGDLPRMGLQGVEMVMLGYNTPFDHTGHPTSTG